MRDQGKRKLKKVLAALLALCCTAVLLGGTVLAAGESEPAQSTSLVAEESLGSQVETSKLETSQLEQDTGGQSEMPSEVPSELPEDGDGLADALPYASPFAPALGETPQTAITSYAELYEAYREIRENTSTTLYIANGFEFDGLMTMAGNKTITFIGVGPQPVVLKSSAAGDWHFQLSCVNPGPMNQYTSVKFVNIVLEGRGDTLGGRSGGITCDDAHATIEGAVFRNCGMALQAYLSPVNGSWMDEPSRLVVKDCVFENNSLAMDVSRYVTTVDNCRFENNYADVSDYSVSRNVASAIYITGTAAGPSRITNSRFYNNTAEEHTNANEVYGAIYVYGGAVEISDCEIIGNTGVNGGGINIFRSPSAVLKNNTITGNTATSSGGGVFLSDVGSAQISGGTISDNSATVWRGGNLWVGDTNLVIDGTPLNGGNSGQEGGALYYEAGEDGDTVHITGSEITGNTSGTLGGAIFIQDADEFRLDGCTLDGNTATRRGGAIFACGSNLNIYGGSISGNTATDEVAGAIFIDGSNVTLDDTVVSGNTAYGNGGAIYADYWMDLVLTDVLLTGNQSLDGSGGAVYFEDYHSSGYFYLDMFGATQLSGNAAAVDGGAIFAPYDYLDRVTAGPDVVFAGNTSRQGYLIKDTDDIAMHNSVIETDQFTAPFAYAYNNHDISYSYGDPLLAHTVTYHPNGGTGGAYYDTVSTAQGAYTVLDDSAVGIGHGSSVFLGWSTVQADTQPMAAYAPGEQVTLSGDLTLYAIWGNAQYLLTYDADGGSPAPSPAQLSVTADTLLTRPVPNPEKTGHSFTGWYTDDGVRWVFERYFDEDLQDYVEADTMPAEDLKLTARYEKKTYKVTLYYNDGTGGFREYPVVFAANFTFPQSPSRAGYTFAGWKGADGTVRTGGSFAMPAQNLDFVAQWTKNSTTSSGPPPVVEPSSSSSSSGTGGGSSTSRPQGSSSTPGSSSSAPTGSSSAVQSVSETSTSAVPPTTSTSNGGGGRGGPGDADYVQPNGTLSLFGNQLPLGGFSSVGGWSILNLLLALLALLSAALLLWRTVRRRKEQRADDEEFLQGGRTAPRRGVWAAVAVATGVLPIILFPILEQLRYGAMLISRWTPLFIALTLVHVGLAAVALFQSRASRTS